MRRAAVAAALLLWRAEAPLPEGNAYVRGLVDRQRHREEVLDLYTYDLLSVREELDDRGAIEESHSRRFEIFSVKGRPVRRLVEEDGRPLSPGRQAREDREARELAEAVRSGRAVSERPGVRLSAILDRYDFRAIAREPLAPLKWGGGLGASVSSLSTRIEFRKVDDAVWLPAEEETVAAGRVLLFKKFRRRFRRTYGGYRRFSVDSQESPRPSPFPSPSVRPI